MTVSIPLQGAHEGAKPSSHEGESGSHMTKRSPLAEKGSRVAEQPHHHQHARHNHPRARPHREDAQEFGPGSHENDVVHFQSRKSSGKKSQRNGEVRFAGEPAVVTHEDEEPVRPTMQRRDSRVSTPGPLSPRRVAHLQGQPDKVDLDSSDSDNDDRNYLATSSTQRKLEELAAKRNTSRTKLATMDASSSQSFQGSAIEEQPGPGVSQLSAIQPMSPTSRRRVIIMNEMSESLRRSGSLCHLERLGWC